MLNLLDVHLCWLVLATVNIPVRAQAVSIFDVTEEVLGLKKADFQNRPPKAAVLALMNNEIRLRYDELERTDPGAFEFMLMLYGHAARTAERPLEAQQIFYNLVDFYKKTMTENQRKILHKLFPQIETIFSPFINPKSTPSQHGSTGNQGSHSSSTTTSGHGSSATTSGDRNKPGDNIAKNATAELASAKAKWQESSFSKYINMKIVRLLIDSHLGMDPEEWQKNFLEGALESLVDSLNGTVNHASISLQNEDFNKANQILLHLCRAFIHKGGCNMAFLDTRIKRISRWSDTRKKFIALVNIIKTQINLLEDRP